MTDETNTAATTAAEQPVVNKEAEEDAKEEEEEKTPTGEEKEQPVASSKQQEEEDPAAEAETPEAVVVELSEEDTKAKEAIVERLSFFFSDANVRQDTFVRKLLMDKSTGGTVPLDVLMRFNTIKKHSSKLEVLISAAKDSKLKDILKVDETNLTVCRVVPFTPQNMKENIPKSLYLQNLPLVPVDGAVVDSGDVVVDKDKTEKKEGEGAKEEETEKDDVNVDVVKKYDVTVDEIRNAFEKYGKVVIVKLKFGNAPPPHGHNNNRNNHQNRHPHRGNRGNNYGPKIPLGEAMVEFETVEGQQKAVEATLTIKDGQTVEPQDVIEFGSNTTSGGGAAVPVQVKLLSEWIEELRKNRDNDRMNNNNNKKRSRDEDEEEEEPLPTYEYDWKPGCVIRLVGLPEDSCDREAILDAVAKGLEIDVDEVKSRKIYADYSRGQTNGAIRFLTPDEGIATLAQKLKDGNIKIGSNGENESGHQVSDAVILDGEEEKTYWQNFIDFKTKQLQEKEREKRAKKKRQKRGGGGGRGGGHHRGGHRGGGGRGGGGGGGHGHYGRDRKDRR